MIAIGVLLGLTTVVMVLPMGASRVMLALCRDGLLPRSWGTTSARRKTPVRLQPLCGAVVAFLAGFTNVGLLEEMINIGTLSAFVMVSLAVPVLRAKRPDRQQVHSFRVPWLPWLSAALCLYLMLNLATLTWLRFGVWLVLGVVVYLAYGARHSRLRGNRPPCAADAARAAPARAAPASPRGRHPCCWTALARCP